MSNQLLKSRALPPLKTKEEMLEILQREEYGYLPPKPTKWHVFEEKTPVSNFCAGKATLQKLVMTVNCNGRDFAFPFYAAIPTKTGRHPFFIHINFRDAVPDRYMPTEELIDHGFAVLSFCYKDVTDDNGDFTDKLAGILYPECKRSPDAPGKIALWAWAAQRVMDWAETDERLDKEISIVCGHSRLGKTALLTAATDERFGFAYSNDSGCSGAAITRGKIGETVRDICKKFPYWFCENYLQYIDNESSMPFDQHYLTACIAPRYLYIASAKEDTWADPDSEFLTCVATSPVYEALGKRGFVHDGHLPVTGDTYHEGAIGYHLRAGTHYFSREDWLKLIDFVEKKCDKKFDR